MGSPMSGEGTLDRLIGYCQANKLSTVEGDAVPAGIRRQRVVRVGNIVFWHHSHDTGAGVDGWIISGDDSYHFMSVPYWFSSHYTFNSMRWEKGAWDTAVNEAIAHLRTLADAHMALVAKATEERNQEAAHKAAEIKAKFEAQFA